MDVNNIEDVKDSRLEDSQPVEETPPEIIDPSLILPDNFCEYINYDSAVPKDQAEECLRRSIIAMPSI